MRNNRNVSGMNRTGFVRAVGAGAMGIAGAAMLGSNVAHAAMPVSGFVDPKVALFYHTTTSTIWKQCLLIAKQVLDEAGIQNVLIPMSTPDAVVPMIPIATPFPLGQAFNLSPCCIEEALNQGKYTAVIGTGTSSTAEKMAAGIMAYGADYGKSLNYFEYSGTANTINPTYPGSPNDMPPLYFHRTAVTSIQWGAACAQELMANLNAASIQIPSNIAFLVRTNPPGTPIKNTEKNVLDSFGLQAKDGFDAYLATLGFGASQLIVMNHTATGMEFLVDNMVGGNITTSLPLTGTWILGSALDSNNAVKLVLAADAAVNAGTTLYLGTVGTVNTQLDGNLITKQFIKDWGVEVIAHHPADPYYEGYLAWTSWGFVNPYTGVPYDSVTDINKIDHRLLRAFDAAWLLVKALISTNTQDGMYNFIENISGRPKKPESYPYKNQLMDPVKTNYNYGGASGPIDFVDGECGRSYFRVWDSFAKNAYNFYYEI